jgi:hypothetical protein
MGAVQQREHPIGIRRVDRVGKPDVSEARVGEDLGLPELGAADADGPVIDLPLRVLVCGRRRRVFLFAASRIR